MITSPSPLFFFFFNDTATTEIYTLSLHDALPISRIVRVRGDDDWPRSSTRSGSRRSCRWRSSADRRSEEHTSELQSPCNLVCRLLLEKKKIGTIEAAISTNRHEMLREQSRC